MVTFILRCFIILLVLELFWLRCFSQFLIKWVLLIFVYWFCILQLRQCLLNLRVFWQSFWGFERIQSSVNGDNLTSSLASAPPVDLPLVLGLSLRLQALCWVRVERVGTHIQCDLWYIAFVVLKYTPSVTSFLGCLSERPVELLKCLHSRWSSDFCP